MARLRNKFAGVDDIYFTKKNIAVRNISTYQDKHGNYRMVDKTRYYPKSSKNLSQARRIHRYIRSGRG